MTCSEIRSLLDAYAAVPKRRREKTFMEVCDPPRFEEVCSRVLGFFLDPRGEHGLGDLFLSAVLRLAGHQGIGYDTGAVTTHVEERTGENKRIDILVDSPQMILGIENKIGAELYNPLHLYRRHLLSHRRPAAINVVLSLRHLTDDELAHASRNGHSVVYYEQLVEEIEARLGDYLHRADPLWTTHLLDFMKTIKHRINTFSMDKEYQFFIEHQSELEALTERYRNFEKDILKAQSEYVERVKALVEKRCGREWWVYRGWDLGFSWGDDPRIGIESSFHATKEGPTAEFRIYVTVWRRQDWEPYEAAVMEAFQAAERGLFLDRSPEVGNRVYLHLPVIHNPAPEQIADALCDAYLKMEAVVAGCKLKRPE